MSWSKRLIEKVDISDFIFACFHFWLFLRAAILDSMTLCGCPVILLRRTSPSWNQNSINCRKTVIKSKMATCGKLPTRILYWIGLLSFDLLEANLPNFPKIQLWAFLNGYNSSSGSWATFTAIAMVVTEVLAATVVVLVVAVLLGAGDSSHWDSRHLLPGLH